ncbi:MAG TPA: hypothetical protein PKA56_03230 [Solirubrobacterales bacterium]|nr:hypothetical protein [Solirubrobacterales bacterium]HMU26479.1 hypothetical protein [Solirubrobacterales bacterium]HMX70747.1 hypothetical protein [Solirubrobacterales bacterium]HMY25644.1 hypothetical protein [Solirubrobacterales bacterium]HNA24306.1 hypothetical protein [Solirubrobacterales bacterium]
MRRYLVLLAALLAGMFIVGGVADAAGKQVKPARPSVKILTPASSQLAKGTVRIQVKANKGAKVRLSAIARSFDTPNQRLFTNRTLYLRKKAGMAISMSLTPEAKATARTCQALTLIITAKNGKKTTRVTRSVNRDLGDCQLSPVDLSRAADCDFIAEPKEGMCMLPFPDDYYTVEDESSPTGKRIHFTDAGMPVNAVNEPISAASYDLSDGFSQGQGIVVKIPGVESQAAVDANDFVPINHIGQYADKNQKAVVINADTGERHPIWVNIDANAGSDQDRVLEIKPAVNFDEKGHYIVALRNLVTAAGKPIAAPTAFRYYRDQIRSSQKPINDRRAHFEQMFETLKQAGIKRRDLYLAWDFTTASNENNYKRALSMRNRAFAELGDTNLGDQIVQGSAPQFTIDSVQVLPTGDIARKIKGHYTVPCFLEPSCGPGGTMNLDANGLPSRNGNYTANMECIIPRVAVQPGAEKTRPMVFGHGLFGDASGVNGGPNPPLAQKGMTICGTDEIGMSNSDVVQVMTSALQNLSHFNVLADRLAQGLINELFLARLMYHPNGLGTAPAFQDGDGFTAGQSLIKTDHVYYMGASQGGIMGGPLTALSPDFTQSSLLVGSMNYSVLLPRSIDFDLYSAILYPSYPGDLAHPLLFQLMQMLWDRSEPNGYAHVMTDNPPPDTPEHKVTLMIAVGDHQVSNYASEVMARTLGMSTNQTPVDEGRWPDYDILWNVPRLSASDYPFHGNNVIYFDGGPPRPEPGNPSKTIGTDVPPFANVPNRSAQDPHGAPGGASVAVEMTSTFLQPNGYISDVCSPHACYGDAWDGSLP